MRYFLKSIATFSFWKYAVFSAEAVGKLLAVVGTLYVLMEIMDFLSIYTKDHYSKYAIIPIFLFALGYVVITRRPVSKVSYKMPRKDCTLEVKIGDLFTEMGDTVISASTTFDTDISGGLISANSLQGQLALRVFEGNTAEIDRQLDAQLEHMEGVDRPDAPGKKKEFPIGTVAKVTTPGRNFYFVAMARLNEHGTAKSTVRNIEDALSGLWQFVTDQGEMRTLLIPLMGTGRGRIDLPRKNVIERIAQSFADASKEKIFTNRLKIIIQPEDAENFALNLLEVRDYLTRSLHV
jgi:hypothetical protein